MRTTLPVVLVLTALGAPGAQIPEQDARNLDVHNSSTHYSMPKFTSREARRARATILRKQILASAGLLPMPEKRPIHAEVFGKMERNGFERVLLETWPGFYLGGDVYRPSGKRGPFPAVVSPLGHWPYRRLENAQLVSVPGRCIILALQGFVWLTPKANYSYTTRGPDFPSDWVKQSAQTGGSRSAETHNAKASEADLLAWLAKASLNIELGGGDDEEERNRSFDGSAVVPGRSADRAVHGNQPRRNGDGFQRSRGAGG